MPRSSRKISKSQIYHAMIRGNERRRIFLDDDDRARFINTIKEKTSENDFSILAYCLMDNHVRKFKSFNKRVSGNTGD